MPNTLPSKVGESSKTVKKTQSSSKRTSSESSKDSDRYETSVVTSTGRKNWYELLQEKIGFDVTVKEWMTNHPELVNENKSEVLIRLACEVCLAQNTEYDPENENEEQNNKYIRFDSQRIFALFEVANPLIEKSDRKNFVEFVCQKGNVQLLEMICRKENSRDFGHIEMKYKWQGTFTGYSKLIDLLQYVIDNRCSPEIVLCLAGKMYGYAHIFYNGGQYLSEHEVSYMKKSFNYQDSVVKGLLKQAIKLGYKDAVSVMLSGDIYHFIRLMKWQRLQEKPEFIEAYDMIKETVADVINSWVEGCKDDIRRLLDQGIEIDLHEMDKKGLALQLEFLGKEVACKSNTNKGKLMKELEGLGERKGKVRLKSTIVGALISTLFFHYQDKVMKSRLFILKIKRQDNDQKGKILNQLDEKIKSGGSIEDIVLELVRSLNLGNHVKNNWFFREVLKKVVNENLAKLKAVCAAICKEPMEELLRGEEIHENVTHVLQFFGVEVLTNQIVKSEIPSSCASIADQFMEDINVYSEKEAKGDCSSDELAFSGLTRKIIRDLEKKQDLTDEEKKDLIFKAVSRIKEGVNILADDTAVKVDAKDIFLSFELINDKITKDERREIVELICQKGSAQLLEMICKQESSKDFCKIEQQYKWQGTFTGYSKLIDLLQYAIGNRCSPEIVLCLTKKMYGHAHVFYNGEQYLKPQSVAIIKSQFTYQDSVVKGLLKQAIKLGYKDAVSVMLSGDIYHSIRLMKWQRLQEEPEFIEAYDMIKEAIADVISSWKEGCKDDIRRLLDQGIEIDIDKIKKKDLILQIEEREVSVPNIKTKKLGQLKEVLGKEVGQKNIKIKLRSTIVGVVIATLFFNYRDQILEGKSFTIKISYQDIGKKKEKIDQLNLNIEDTVLELINVLNSASHISNSWFFREVLVKVVNENLDKLKAVCAAICKEPMEELLKGEEIHENVIDVLQFFGVEKDFLLLRKNTTNVAVSVSVKSIDESLSDTSEKSVSLSGQQSLADDRPKNPSALQARGSKSLPNSSTELKETQEQSGIGKSVPTLKSQKSHLASSSKLTEKNNEGAMQKNYGQNKSNRYSNVDDFCYQDKTISRRLVMPRVDLQSARNKRKERESVTLQKVSKQALLDPPKFKNLFKANRMMYMKKTLDDFVLSYDALSYHSSYGISSLQFNLNESGNSGGSYEDDEQEFNELFINNDYFHKYEDAVKKLIKGDIPAAQNLLLELAEQAIEPACYARALSLFKELMKECDVQNNKEENDKVMEKGKDDIKEAVELLEFCVDTMNPASSFLLGIMKAFNIGNCSRFTKGPWQKDLANVINVGQAFGGDCSLEESILQAVKRGSWDVQGSVGLGMKNRTEDVKKMFKYSLYEFVFEMISEKNINRSAVNDAFAVLSKDDFPEGLYAHGYMIIDSKIGGDSQGKVAIKLLNCANELGHKGAKFMLGTLPLQKEVYCTSQKEIMSYIRILESYLNESDDSCDLNKLNVNKAALCLVAEYSSKRSVFLEYDEAKIEEILNVRGLHQRWKDIQHESTLSLGNDSFSRVGTMQSSTPRCSVAESQEPTSFSCELSAIGAIPGTKLSKPLAKNQSASRNLRK